MLLCTLPYSTTSENHITRTARLGDGSTLTVTFSTGIPEVPLPFGSDRKLLAWVFDRAINSESPVIGWESAWEYQKELGLKRSGKNNRYLRARFHRISGLNINIERKDASGIAARTFPSSTPTTCHRPSPARRQTHAAKSYVRGCGRRATPSPVRHLHQPNALPRHPQAPCGCSARAVAALERELAGAGYDPVALLPLLCGQDGVNHSMGCAGRAVSRTRTLGVPASMLERPLRSFACCGQGYGSKRPIQVSG